MRDAHVNVQASGGAVPASNRELRRSESLMSSGPEAEALGFAARFGMVPEYLRTMAESGRLGWRSQRADRDLE